jgi:hypothetical protein
LLLNSPFPASGLLFVLTARSWAVQNTVGFLAFNRLAAPAHIGLIPIGGRRAGNDSGICFAAAGTEGSAAARSAAGCRFLHLVSRFRRLDLEGGRNPASQKCRETLCGVVFLAWRLYGILILIM